MEPFTLTTIMLATAFAIKNYLASRKHESYASQNSAAKNRPKKRSRPRASTKHKSKSDCVCKDDSGSGCATKNGKLSIRPVKDKLKNDHVAEIKTSLKRGAKSRTKSRPSATRKPNADYLAK